MPVVSHRHLLILGVSVLVLLITLSFPFNYDQTIFMIGGEKIVLHGGIPFRDVLDTKPLMIMYLYGFSSALFGHSMVSIRVVDLLFQLTSLFFVYRITIRIFKNEEIAPWAVTLYSLLYVSFDYTATSQAETFALLPALYIIDVVTKAIDKREVDDIIRTSVLTALASVFILLLKTSLAVIPISLLGFLLFKKGISNHIRFVVTLVIFSLILLGGFIYYLHVSGALENMMSVFSWLSDYSGAKDADIHTTVSNWALLELPKNFTMVYSFTTLILLGMGIYLSLKELRTASYSTDWSDRSYIYLFIIVFAVSFSSIVFERKFFGYSFTRLLASSFPFIILPMIGAIKRFNGFRRIERTSPITQRWPRTLMLTAMVSLILFFSPIYSVADRGIRRIFLALNAEDVLADLKTTDRFNTIADQRDLSDTLKTFIKKDDTVFIWGNHIGPYYFLSKTPPTFITTSVMLISPWASTRWKNQMMNELRKNIPTYFLAEQYDYVDIISGYKLDSFRGMQEFEDFYTFIRDNYDSITTTHNFSIYSRKQRL